MHYFVLQKGELNSRTIADEGAAGYEVDSLKQQIEDLRVILCSNLYNWIN